ncbi:MAG: hypothetical protein Q9195_007149 [Heterodermia aff. obscurata]
MSGPVSQYLSQIETNTKKYLSYFASNGLSEPSYESGDGLHPLQPPPSDIIAFRDAALQATDELHNLLLGPLGLLLSSPGDQYLLLSLQYIYRYKLADRVPAQGLTSFEHISREAGLDVNDVRRFLRVAIARHVFIEPEVGSIGHTAASRLLVDNPMLEAWVMNIAEEFWPSLSRMVDATAEWPGSQEPNETGYSLSHNTDENPFDIIRREPRKHQQFVNAMSFSHLHPSFGVKYLVDNYDFGSIGPGTIVDVGGSHGQVSTAIARKYPEVKCIVQDLPGTIAGLESQIPADLKDRITGMAHDFLTPQLLHGADIYLLRWILHDWSDKYSVKILKCLVPALKRGAKILINDICIPTPGQLGIAADRNLRQVILLSS